MIGKAFYKAVEERDLMDVGVIPRHTRGTVTDEARKFCDFFGIKVKDLRLNESKKEEEVRLRAMFCAYTDPVFGPSEVGRFLGKDHSTVIHHRTKHQDRMDHEDVYYNQFATLKLLT